METLTTMQAETLDGIKLFGGEVVSVASAGYRGRMVKFRTEARKTGFALLGPSGACKGEVAGVRFASYDELLKLIG